MENIIKFLSLLGGAIAFLIGLFKWLDIRQREIKNQKFEQFHKIFEWVAGRTAEGKTLVDVQQAMAVYQLAEFPEYKEMSLPVLEYYIEKTKDESEESLFRKALLKTKTKLNT